MEENRRLAAIMFTDIVGYTSLMGSDEDRAFQLLRKNRNIQRPLIRKHRGEWLKEMGDGILASFNTATDAVRCAGEIQRASKEEGINLRIGIHEGEVVFAGGDVLGDGVNIASRLQESAEEGGIVISASVYQDIKNKPEIRAEWIGDKHYKNVDEPIRVYSVTAEFVNENQKINLRGANRKLRLSDTKARFLFFISGLVMISIAVTLWRHVPIINENEPKKSIAVLPFKLQSAEPDKQYLADGMMDAILLHLSRIDDLHVMSGTSTEQYRVTGKTITEIGRELGVEYLLEGSFQKSDSNVRLIVRLIKASVDDLVWSEEYERNLNEIFIVQSEVAKSIAGELNSVISTELEHLIEKAPTANLTAYDFYQRGREDEGRYSFYDLIASSATLAGLDPTNKQSIERAERMYKNALKYDPYFALVYARLAGIYWSKNYYREYFSENFMDSALILANTALSFDNKLADAYYVRGIYYSEHGLFKRALENFNKALELNPNYWLAYFSKAAIENDATLAITNYMEAASRIYGPGLSDIFQRISFVLSLTGFSALAEAYIIESVKLESDSTKYFFWLWMYEFDFEKCFKFYEKRYLIDYSDITALNFLAAYYQVTGQHEESLKFYKKYINVLESEERLRVNEMQRVGYAYWKSGFEDSANYYLNQQIKYCNNVIRLGRNYTTAFYDLAGVYAFMGDKIKAYEYLTMQDKDNLWLVKWIKIDPLFNSIRNESEFQKIIGEMDAKYMAEHEKVRKLLEEQDKI